MASSTSRSSTALLMHCSRALQRPCRLSRVQQPKLYSRNLATAASAIVSTPRAHRQPMRNPHHTPCTIAVRSHSTDAMSSSSSPASTSPQPSPSSTYSSIDAAEVSKFAKASADWWNPRGQFEMLHKMNPMRVKYIRDQYQKHSQDPSTVSTDPSLPFAGLRMLDIGCGGGLLSESLSRLGASVDGVDAAPENIAMATIHAQMDPFLKTPNYQASTAEDLVTKVGDGYYDVVCGLEIVEHVKDPEEFIATCVKLVKPGGLVFFSTINRTVTSYLFTIFMAESVLRWVPEGTHDHAKYITPSEFVSYLQRSGASALDTTGMGYSLVNNDWELLQDGKGPLGGMGALEMNYILCARRNL
ncbi:hypothetical protein HDU76_010534 [Blyttiomyces sp. JEL0837]|nr:hypothetical protein HDU76_010534 [Blyttiomyces sp. JEL0837]